MPSTHPAVDAYLAEGCGRCPLGGTPECKVHPWAAALQQLRRILLTHDLTETRKWGVPCYTFAGKNLALIGAFKDHCTLSLLQGALPDDPHGLLEKPGPHSQVDRVIRFRSEQEVLAREPLLSGYLAQAKAVQQAGLKVQTEAVPEAIPAELQATFDEDPVFQAAFEALTPGRQRGYLIYFSGAKKAGTRSARIEKHRERIMQGKGMQDR